jgi:hypothetical protein
MPRSNFVFDRKAGILGLDQSEDDIGCDEGTRFVVHPPPPTAVVVLAGVEPLQADTYLLAQVGLQFGIV